MIAKLIEVQIKPGCDAPYLAAQEIWNREMRRHPDCLGTVTGREPSRPDVVWVTVLWRSRDAYERWMQTEHDRIAALAGADRYYDKIVVRTLDSAFPESERMDRH
jgi:antibiotic biosynthesis monooxygenase (ABM) superfamily enzyme